MSFAACDRQKPTSTNGSRGTSQWPFAVTRARGGIAALGRGVIVGLFGLQLGCSQLDRFETNGNEAYCGSLVSTPGFHDGFIKAGAPPTLRLSLTLDIQHLTTLPGTLSSDDSANGPCSERGLPLFSKAPLYAMEEVLHDPISLLEFGDGREHNFMAWVESNCVGALLSVVSLMNSGAVEVRLFKPAAQPSAKTPPEQRPGFGLFHLERQNAGCGLSSPEP